MESKTFFEKYVKVFVVVAVVAGSTSGIFGSVIEAPAMTIGFWRLTLALPFFAVPVLKKGTKVILEIDRRSLIFTAMAGIFLFLHFFSWFTAVKLTNIASASVLAAFHPIVVLIITVFVFKKRVSRRSIMGIVCALAGGSLIAGFDYEQLSAGNFQGDVLAFFAAVFMGLYFAMGQMARRGIDGPTYVFLVFLSCWICFVIGVTATGTPIFGYSLESYIYIVALTLICQIGAHAVFNLCIGHVSSLYISAWESGEAVSAIVMGIVFLGQIPTRWQVIGMAIVVIGLLYYNYYSNVDKIGEQLHGDSK